MCFMMCNPLCGGCPTKPFHVFCKECMAIVRGGVEKCSKCGAPLPQKWVFCEAYQVDCNTPCRMGRDPGMKGKNIRCRKMNGVPAAGQPYLSV